MINASNEFLINLKEKRQFSAKATITLADNSILNVTEEDIVVKGMSFSDATSKKNSFEVGTAIINSCTLLLNNVEKKFSGYDFSDAVIRPYIGLRVENGIEWLEKGVFTVQEPTENSSIIYLSAVDYMQKTERPFSEVSVIIPATVRVLLNAICNHCGVVLNTQDFTNKDFVIAKDLIPEYASCREVIAWISQITGNNARFNNKGYLELKWYDLSLVENEENYHTFDAIERARIYTDDIEVNGIEVKTENNTYLFGEHGYIVRIEDNPLITDATASTIVSAIGDKIVGMKFRPLEIYALSNPTVECGDVGIVIDRFGNEHNIIITNASYVFGEVQIISCDAEPIIRNKANRAPATARIVQEIKKDTQERLNAVEIATKQFNDLVTHALGYYQTEIVEDGLKISYIHDKPTLEESVTIWKQTIDTFSVSNDGGETWAGMDSDGNLIANLLNVIGVNAEWINVISDFMVGTNFKVDSDGNLTTTNAKMVDINAESGTIAGFNFNADSESALSGLYYSDLDTGKYIRFSPLNTRKADGSVDTTYGSLDIGYVEVVDEEEIRYSTLVHIRSDGYVRFGKANETAGAIKFNDYLRLDEGIEGTNPTDTIMYAKNFQIETDGTIRIKSPDIPQKIKSVNISDNSFTLGVGNETIDYDLTKDSQGRIKKIVSNDGTINVTWD